MEETKNVEETLADNVEVVQQPNPETPAVATESQVAEASEAKDTETSDDSFNEDELKELYEQSFEPFIEGELVKGKVLAIFDNTVMIDIGYKSEGLVDVNEFKDLEGNIGIAVGDDVEILLEATENIEGQLVLSKEKAEKMKVWDDIEEAYKNNEVIKGRVIDRIKGGLAVDVGVRAFLPGSQVDVRPVRNLDSFKGETIRVKVIKLNKRRGNIVLSRKEVIEAENNDRRQETLRKLTEEDIVKGVVKNITEYGAFIDLGGIDGLLHITDMSWGRINHPSELFNVGDEIEVVVLKYDTDTDRVSLGYKQRWSDPWENAEEKYPVNARISGKIVSITDYGAFIELEEGIEGLIHVSEMSWSKRVKHPSKMVNIGDAVEAVVLDIDTSSRRISLGLKQIDPNPWVLVKERYREGEILKGKVRNITDFGAFIEIDEGIDGLIHVSDMSWSKRIKHPSEVLKKGDEVEATVLHIDVDNQRLSLGLKQLSEDSYEAFYSSHRVGDVINCTVIRATTFGVFVDLGFENVEGIIHASDLEIAKGKSPEEMYSEGNPISAKIVKIETDDHKISLSAKAIRVDEEKTTKKAYMKKTSGKATLGDVFGDILGVEEEKKKDKPKETEKKAKTKAAKKSAEVDEAEAEEKQTASEDQDEKKAVAKEKDEKKSKAEDSKEDSASADE